MTAATGRVYGAKPIGEEALPRARRLPLAASVSPFRNWLMGINASGYTVAMAGDVVGLISAGFADADQEGSAIAAAASVVARQQFVTGFANGTSTDALGAADFAIPAWAADNATVGKLSNSGGVNRSIAGLAMGLDEETGLPVFLPGPIGWLLARAAHVMDEFVGASLQISDAAASTTTAERPIARKKAHGTVSSIQLVGLAIAADNSDYITVTVAKRDGAGGGAVTLGTYDSRAANQGAVTAFVPAEFSLSAVAGALDLLETDIVTVTVAKGGSGKQIIGEIRVIQKVG